jgi:hypothetical protein
MSEMGGEREAFCGFRERLGGGESSRSIGLSPLQVLRRGESGMVGRR